MTYLSPILTVAGIHLLAVMSPGPDFILVTKNSLAHSRKSGVYSAFGLAAGVLTHVTYCLAGIGLLISRSIVLFSIIKFVGALYLMYIGYQALRSQPDTQTTIEAKHSEFSPLASFKMGYLTNVTNPKATLFILSLFTLVISPATPFVIKLIMGLEMGVVTAAWFSGLSFIVSHHLVKDRFAHIQHRLEQGMGAILIALGLKVALTRSH